jgi:hypothetical protein
MSSSRTTLLTLLREVRDQIYTYLTHEIKVLVYYPNGAFSGFFCHEDYILHSANAPIPSVLQVYSCIHDEYLESSPFRNMLVTVYIDETAGSANRLMPPETTETHAGELMRDAKHARIAFNCHPDGPSHSPLLCLEHYWDFLEEIRAQVRRWSEGSGPQCQGCLSIQDYQYHTSYCQPCRVSSF